MDKRLKIAALLIAALMIISLLTGCMATTFGVAFTEDGRVSLLTRQYLAGSYIEANGKTPEQFYSSQIESGQKLESVRFDGETYWGLGGEPMEFASPKVFKNYLDTEDSSVSVTYYNNDPDDGLYTVQLDFKVSPLNDLLADGQEDFDPQTKELLDKTIVAGTVYFPEGYFTISINTLQYGEYSVDSDNKTCSFYVHPSYKYGYTVSVFGYIKDDGSLSNSKELEPLRNIWARTDLELQQGMSPKRITWRIDTNPGGVLDKPTEVIWEMGDDGVNWEKMPESALFEAGKLYRARVSLDLGHGYEFTDDTVVGANGVTVKPYMVYGDHLEFARVFPPVVTDDAEYISSIDITLDEPREGLVIGEAGCSIAASPNASIAEALPLMWFSAPNRAVDYRFADTAQTFDPELCYGYTLALVPRAGFKFSEDTAVRVNGKEIWIFTLDPNWMYIDIEVDEVLPPAASEEDTSAASEPIVLIPGVQLPEILLPNIPGYKIPGLKEGPIYHITPVEPATDTQSAPAGGEPEVYGQEAAAEGGADVQTGQAAPAVSGQGTAEPAQSVELPFSDVPENAYYHDAVAWAYSHEPQITDGTSPTTFSPHNTCTRAQVVTFLWRAAGCPEPEDLWEPFDDVDDSDWFYKPVIWAVSRGITDGTGPTTFSPASTCRNSHILTFIWRAMGEPDKTGEGAWWQDAFNWADRQGLLDGSYGGSFNINAECSRANVVYYLWQMQR